MPPVKVHDERFRQRLLEEAGALIASSGMDGLSVRRLADAVGSSTMAVYTLFGDKGGLLEALFVHGFERLGVALRAVRETDNPLDDLLKIGLAYRRFALKNPNVYELLFGRGLGRAATTERTRNAATVPEEVMHDGITRCVGAGAFAAHIDIDAVAYHLWGLAHGLVSLELAGCVEGGADARARRYEGALAASGIAYLAT